MFLFNRVKEIRIIMSSQNKNQDSIKDSGKFGSRLGFILAAAGSAVGLGNIWRFPYLAAKYGGGLFLLVYIILAVTFGFALLLTEIAIGRRTGKSVIGAYRSIDKRFSFLGWFAALVPVIITPYYCIYSFSFIFYACFYCIIDKNSFPGSTFSGNTD